VRAPAAAAKAEADSCDSRLAPATAEDEEAGDVHRLGGAHAAGKALRKPSAGDASAAFLEQFRGRVYTNKPVLSARALGAALREHTEDVETAAAEGARAAQQLREQLVEESSTRALLDALRRATRELTDRYEVPRGALQVGEWRLPRAAPVLEVAFRELATTFLEADVAPRLIGATREAAARVAPLAQALAKMVCGPSKPRNFRISKTCCWSMCRFPVTRPLSRVPTR
jgi:hypothetical protein